MAFNPHAKLKQQTEKEIYKGDGIGMLKRARVFNSFDIKG